MLKLELCVTWNESKTPQASVTKLCARSEKPLKGLVLAVRSAGRKFSFLFVIRNMVLG